MVFPQQVRAVGALSILRSKRSVPSDPLWLDKLLALRPLHVRRGLSTLDNSVDLRRQISEGSNKSVKAC